ncbi:hypothetical protein EJ08DRAFT_646431 [Tothia fuscella]|uniref:EGF-like domain-containing protein n=1 Tax=Tothia fuscella TaxID=1048955 RepID=A0A9P4U2Z4_9PEZI|nr:hypothetical protein EJ08DRAFT_646431 [Tothia fuscella]
MRFARSSLVAAAIVSSAFAAPQAGAVTVTAQLTPAPKASTPPPAVSTIPFATFGGSPPTTVIPSPRPSLSPAPPNPAPAQVPPPKASSASAPRPRFTPRPSPPPSTGPSVICGGGRPGCPTDQYCYDANQDRVIGTTDANSIGFCYGATCGATTGCPVGQICGEGRCLNQNLDCGFLGDECPEEAGWRCIGGRGYLARGYCGYSPKFTSF